MSGFRTLLLAVVGGLGLGMLAAGLWPTGRQAPAPDIVGQPVPDFALAGLDGRLWRAGDLEGRALLVNFWATWCQPCIREMPLLDRIHDEHAQRLRVVGIAVDDPDRVAEFVATLGIDYPILIGTDEVHALPARFGNRGGMLPYSVLVDADGIVRWHYLGELDRERLNAAIGRVL